LGQKHGQVVPLLRLCVLHRLRHRWELGDEGGDLAPLIKQAEEDLDAHFRNYAELLKQKWVAEGWVEGAEEE
jgi:hypothetical protein